MSENTKPPSAEQVDRWRYGLANNPERVLAEMENWALPDDEDIPWVREFLNAVDEVDSLCGHIDSSCWALRELSEKLDA